MAVLYSTYIFKKNKKQNKKQKTKTKQNKTKQNKTKHLKDTKKFYNKNDI